MNPLKVTPTTINNFKQNKPSLIAMDLQEHFGVPPDATWRILLARGVCKWLDVRQMLIDYKHELKAKTTELIDQVRAAKKLKDTYRTGYLKGYLAATVEHRKRLRELCRMRRWNAPYDYTPEWLESERVANFVGLTMMSAVNPDKYRRAQEHIRLLRAELRGCRTREELWKIKHGNRTEIHG